MADVKNSVCAGVDLPIAHLPIHTRQIRCRIMDPQDPLGRDRCLLAVTLGLETCLPSLDANCSKTENKTERMLEEWSDIEPNASIGQLLSRLRTFNRDDAAEVILRTAPIFRVLVYNDQSADKCATFEIATASTNMLSNLSSDLDYLNKWFRERTLPNITNITQSFGLED